MSPRSPHVHRKLVLTSPLVRGEDVEQLQYGINRHRRARKFPEIKVDGVLGRKTKGAAVLAAFAMGLSQHQIKKLKRGVITEHAQKHLRGTTPRLAIHKQRARNRAERVARIRRRQFSGARRTIRWAVSQRGQTEDPSGSNRGQKISRWQELIIGFDGVPWCGCFTGFGTKYVGGVRAITSRVAYTPYTKLDGINRENGFIGLVPPEKARLGDHLLFNFQDGTEPPGVPQHTGFALVRISEGWKSMEGNTSSGNSGSQDNGGGVFPRSRPNWTIVGAARPDYAKAL